MLVVLVLVLGTDCRVVAARTHIADIVAERIGRLVEMSWLLE